jgi:hypothetical protein
MVLLIIISAMMVLEGFFLTGAKDPARQILGAALFLTGMSSLLLLRMEWRFDGAPGQFKRFLLMVFALAGLLGGICWFAWTIAGDPEAWTPVTWQNLCGAGFCAACGAILVITTNRQNRSV